MSFKKFFSLVFQLGFFTFKSIQLGIIFCSFCGDYFLYARFQQNSDFRWKLVCFIDFFNLFLYNIYQNSLCCAIFSPFTMTPTAYKIWIYIVPSFFFSLLTIIRSPQYAQKMLPFRKWGCLRLRVPLILDASIA